MSIEIKSATERGIENFKPRKSKKIDYTIDNTTSVIINEDQMIAHFKKRDGFGFVYSNSFNLLQYDYTIEELKKDFEFEE